MQRRGGSASQRISPARLNNWLSSNDTFPSERESALNERIAKPARHLIEACFNSAATLPRASFESGALETIGRRLAARRKHTACPMRAEFGIFCGSRASQRNRGHRL
jgi:hypothetical protein